MNIKIKQMKNQKYERPVINKITAGVPDKFGLKTPVKTMSHIEDISVEELLSKYGSPLYVISERTIHKTFTQAYKAFSSRYPRVQFAWSYKTNYLNAVCRSYHKMGLWAEVVSGFEYEKAISNGVPGDQIIFNGPNKSVAELEVAIRNGTLIHLDHLDEFFLLSELVDTIGIKAKVGVRINMDSGIYPQWDRFGFNYENGEAWNVLNRIMIHERLELVGLHTHIGTYIMSAEAYAIAASKLSQLAVRLNRKFNHVINYLDLGGGFASKNTLKGAYLPASDTNPSFEDYAEAITSSIIGSDLSVDQLPLLILETGRALIDDAGYLLGTVLANKRLSDGRRATIIDVGVGHLFTSFWYDHQVLPVKVNSQQAEDTTIYGPLCMNIDVIREAIRFPLLQRGDKIVITGVGAYNMTQWMQFINLRPAVVMIDDVGKTHLIRKKETLEGFDVLESIPES